jgi:hypothetical protein
VLRPPPHGDETGHARCTGLCQILEPTLLRHIPE